MELTALPLAELEILWGQTIGTRDIVVVILLVLLEGMLSIDNALVLGLLAKRLPAHQRSRALTYGLVGAFVFRLIAIAAATFLLQWTFAKFLGGAYLVYIAGKHLFFDSRDPRPEKVVLNDQGEPVLVDAITGEPLSPSREDLEISERAPFDVNVGRARDATTAQVETRDSIRRFWWTVFVIEMTDIAFAVDSIVAAIGIVGTPPGGLPKDAVHPKLWVIILGGFLGVVMMRFAAFLFIRMLDRFPRFEVAAYVLVIAIGLKLLLDWGFNSDWSGWGWTGNEMWAEHYVAWLDAYWPLKLPPESLSEPHLLDFHDLRRPECMLFWLSMVGTFCFGFIGKKENAPRD